MNRRTFLQRATLALGGLAIDPERLLWVPGAKTIFLPSVTPVEIPWAEFIGHLNMALGGGFGAPLLLEPGLTPGTAVATRAFVVLAGDKSLSCKRGSRWRSWPKDDTYAIELKG